MVHQQRDRSPGTVQKLIPVLAPDEIKTKPKGRASAGASQGIVAAPGMVDNAAEGLPSALDRDEEVCYAVNGVGQRSIEPREVER